MPGVKPEQPGAEADGWVAGVDGCRAGWFVIMRHLESGDTCHHTAADFAAVLQWCAGAAVVAVDMPIGLMDTVQKGGRLVDRLARQRLKPHRSSSVFSPPCRPALACLTYEEAVRVTRSLSAGGPSLTLQSFGLFPKLREVDDLMTPERQGRVCEVHPELAFAQMNGGRPLEVSKKKAAGQEQRIQLLQAAGFDISTRSVSRLARAGVGRTDVLDAYAACWTAARIATGKAERLPEHPGTDARGLRMELWV